MVRYLQNVSGGKGNIALDAAAAVATVIAAKRYRAVEIGGSYGALTFMGCATAAPPPTEPFPGNGPLVLKRCV